MSGTMNLLNAAKTIWKDDLEGKRFTILARMRFMEALVLKDYLQKQHDPNSPYSASKASSDHFVRLMVKRMVSLCVNQLF
jgi:dTDP-glucose 4,6-dehydratase